jgi:hypothetical protein
LQNVLDFMKQQNDIRNFPLRYIGTFLKTNFYALTDVLYRAHYTKMRNEMLNIFSYNVTLFQIFVFAVLKMKSYENLAIK